MLPYSISPVILGFLLGLMFNTVLYVIPEYLVSNLQIKIHKVINNFSFSGSEVIII